MTSNEKRYFTGVGLIAVISISSLALSEFNSKNFNYKYIKIEKKNLETLKDVPSFQSLYLNPKYDETGIFSPDDILLFSSAWTDHYDRIKLDDIANPFVEIQNEDERFPAELIFSEYELPKNHIDSLVAIPGVNYFIFKPAPYSEDKNYVYYQIIPYDGGGQVITITDNDRLLQMNPCPPAKPYLVR